MFFSDSLSEVSLDYLLIYFTFHLLGMIFLTWDQILHFQIENQSINYRFDSFTANVE
jgi:hypothetical protein